MFTEIVADETASSSAIPGMPPLPARMNQDAMKAEIASETLALIQTDMMRLQGEVIEKAFSYADRQAKTLMNSVKEELAKIERPLPQVLKVNVNGIKVDLKKPASPVLPRLIANAKLGLNSLLVGPAGCGKSIAAEQLSESLSLPFGQICFTAGASETWIFGRQTPTGFIEGTFSKLYKGGGVFLGDELDAADANMMLSINTALANGHLYNPISGELIKRHKDFHFVGCANTFGRGGDNVYTGRSRLDGATLNRFVMLEVEYCSKIEKLVCPDDELRKQLQAARKKLASLKASEIISTRSLDQCFKQKQAGIPRAEILKSLTLGWPEELVDQCRLNETKEVIPF